MKSILWKVNGGVQRLDDKLEHIQFLTGNTLKVIAVLTMIVDHICKIVLQWLLTDGYWGVMLDSGKMSWEQYQQIDYFIRFDLQSIGTIAFPLFCFLLWRSRTRSVCGQIGFAFFIGGTIGNAIDRFFVQAEPGMFFSGKVRDFISFSIFPPVFNVADSFLVIGVILAMIAILFLDPDGLLAMVREERRAKKAGGGKEDGSDDENH